MALAYRRALLKISGEALAGDRGVGLDYPTVEDLARQIKDVHAQGIRLGLVVGGGNIVRGTAASAQGLDRVSADYMGMLATVINALALQDVLERSGSRPGCSPRSGWNRWRSRIFDGGRCGTWRRGGW